MAWVLVPERERAYTEPKASLAPKWEGMHVQAIFTAIQNRPVRFFFLVEALLGAAVVFGVALTQAQLGALLLVVNTLLAFVVEGFTTPVDFKTGEARSPAYERKAEYGG